MGSERNVAVGLLTLRDLDVLGVGCRRAFPLTNASDFASLLVQIDQADEKQLGSASDQALRLTPPPHRS
jgi:hypothetical protein